MPSKLYVGNLPYPVSDGELEELFSQVGEVHNATVIVDKLSGRSKGFGFVEMASAEDAATAIEELNDMNLKGRNIQVSEARPRQPKFGHSGPSQRG